MRSMRPRFSEFTNTKARQIHTSRVHAKKTPSPSVVSIDCNIHHGIRGGYIERRQATLLYRLFGIEQLKQLLWIELI
jgi:hypothetical protein